MVSPVSRKLADKSTQPPPAQFTFESYPAYTFGQPGPCENPFVKTSKSMRPCIQKIKRPGQETIKSKQIQ